MAAPSSSRATQNPSGSGAPAPAVEDAFACSAATQDHLGGCSQVGMTGRLVVPTLAGAPPQNQSLGGFRVASCESRAKAGSLARFLRGGSVPAGSRAAAETCLQER